MDDFVMEFRRGNFVPEVLEFRVFRGLKVHINTCKDLFSAFEKVKTNTPPHNPSSSRIVPFLCYCCLSLLASPRSRRSHQDHIGLQGSASGNGEV